jgi:hypothetical protein
MRLLCTGALLAAAMPGARAADPSGSPPPGSPTRASPAPGSPADIQVVGLFMQTCMRFVGNALALRQWAVRSGLQPLPEQGQQEFLYGLPGQVFDASTKDGKLVLISENGGSCSAMAEAADGRDVVTVLERVMTLSHIDFQMTHEDDDSAERVLHHREYTASEGTRQWQMLISTVKGTAAGEVMLTTNP